MCIRDSTITLADGDRTATEHDWIEITGDLELAGELDVSLIDKFKLSAGQSFVIAKVGGELINAIASETKLLL